MIKSVVNVHVFKSDKSALFPPRIRSLKERVRDKEGIPEDQMRFVFAGKELRDDSTLADYNVCGWWGSTCFVV